MDYFVHKFRATIGKNKILEKNEEVIYPYSGSGSSVAMLHLISQVTWTIILKSNQKVYIKYI